MALATVFGVWFIFYTVVGNPCRIDWELFEESCYGFGEANVTWSEAGEMCRSTGAKLAEIETAEENEFLKTQAMHKKGNSYWLGGTDVFHDGTWTWMSTGELISPFTDWGSTQPDDAGGVEDCLVLWKPADYKWNDVDCEAHLNFICESPAKETVVG